MLKGIRWFLGLFATPAIALTGGMDSGGGGLRGFESNPWFIGSREVTYCVQANPEFPDASGGGVRGTVKHAFAQWRKFQEDYRLNKRTFNLELPGEKSLGIDLQYVEVDDCESADLKVMIGVTDKTVRRILKSYPPKTYAFAHLTSPYDFENFTENNKGVIWVAQPEQFSGKLFPPYDKRPILPLVLLHEIGHTMGIGHLHKYSIMSGDIFELMSVAEDDEEVRAALKKFAYIDNPTPLISFGRITKWVAAEDSQIHIQRFFKEAIGREPEGPVEFLLVTIPRDDVKKLDQKATAIVADKKGRYKVGMQLYVGTENTWPYCKIKLAWKGVAPKEPRDIRTHGCLDSLSSDYLVGSIFDQNGEPIDSKVGLGLRQKVLMAFGGNIRRTRFNIHLKLAGAVD